MSSIIRYISASAGTGKTYKLVKEITRAMDEGADPSGIVATTYTNLAARELETRLQRHLHQGLGIHPRWRTWQHVVHPSQHP